MNLDIEQLNPRQWPWYVSASVGFVVAIVGNWIAAATFPIFGLTTGRLRANWRAQRLQALTFAYQVSFISSRKPEVGLALILAALAYAVFTAAMSVILVILATDITQSFVQAFLSGVAGAGMIGTAGAAIFIFRTAVMLIAPERAAKEALIRLRRVDPDAFREAESGTQSPNNLPTTPNEAQEG